MSECDEVKLEWFCLSFCTVAAPYLRSPFSVLGRSVTD